MPHLEQRFKFAITVSREANKYKSISFWKALTAIDSNLQYKHIFTAFLENHLIFVLLVCDDRKIFYKIKKILRKATMNQKVTQSTREPKREAHLC